MAIYVPGKRGRKNRFSPQTKRKVVAALSLTAMVDMFTVLVVFLLQNYATTGEVLEIDKSVVLPTAESVKDLKPANVVMISSDRIMLNNEFISDYESIKDRQDWLIDTLKEKIERIIFEGNEEKNKLQNQIKAAVSRKNEADGKDEIDSFKKITIQADQMIDFLTVKKVMYTVTEAGIIEINFAVIKKPKEANSDSI